MIENRNKFKQIFPIKKKRKHFQNEVISSSLINVSIKNKKIAESISPSINMNRTTSELLYKKQQIPLPETYKKIKKFNTLKKNKNHFNSTVETHNKRNKNNFRLKNIKKISKSNEKKNNNIYNNYSSENIKVSNKIYNELDKIQKTILEDIKKLIPKNEENKNQVDEIRNNNSNNIKIENIKKLKTNSNSNNNTIDYFYRNNNNKYFTVPIKSQTSYNFFPISQSHRKIKDSSNINNFHTYKRLKSTEDKKPHIITRFLDRTKINGLPVTFPLFLSYNNKYNSISEKNRVDKILNKLIHLQTHIIRDPLNRKEIIKEFFLKNGFDKNIFFEEESINNFYNYLKQPFSFPPEYNLSQVINDGINFKYDKEQYENIDINSSIFLDYKTKERKWDDQVEYISKKKINNEPFTENEIIYNLLMEEIFKKRYISYDNLRNKTLPMLIKDLESELRQIKIDKMNKLDKYNNLIDTKKLETIKLSDNNKYVPNLCLVSQGFREKCKAVVDKKNRKIIKNINKQEHLKKINNRLYYDNIRKNNLLEFDRNDIQRKLKLTEFVVMERAKKILLLQKAKNKFISRLDKINKSK